MTDDDGDLRAQIARLDPARRREVADLIEGRTAHEIRERAMQTIDRTTDQPASRATGHRRRAIVLAAAASVAAIGVAAAVLTSGGSATRPDSGASTLTLKAPASGGGTSMSSCLPFDVGILRDMPVAFGGTVTDVNDSGVTLDVDRWYKGGSAEQVTVSTPAGGAVVSIDGVEFVAGRRYLVTATDGTVNTCGYSGEHTAELAKSFDEAFGG